MDNLNEITLDLLTNEMTIKFNMLGSLMKDGFACNMQADWLSQK